MLERTRARENDGGIDSDREPDRDDDYRGGAGDYLPCLPYLPYLPYLIAASRRRNLRRAMRPVVGTYDGPGGPS